MTMKTVLKQPEKNVQRDPGERDGLAITVERRGTSSGIALRHLSCLPAPRLVCKGPHWKRDCPQRRRSPGLDSQDNQDWRCPGGLHTSSRPNYAWGTPGINNCEGAGAIHRFPFRYWSNLLRAYWSPWPTFFWICFHNGTVWTSKNVLLQCFCQLWLRFGAIFTWVSDRARVSLTAFGKGYTEQGPCLCFHKYGAFPFSPFNWAKCKS